MNVSTPDVRVTAEDAVIITRDEALQLSRWHMAQAQYWRGKAGLEPFVTKSQERKQARRNKVRSQE